VKLALDEHAAILLKDYPDELDVLWGLFPDSILNQILLKSINERLKLRQETKQSRQQRRRSVQQISIDQFKCFWIAHLCMWLCSYPELKLYWESDSPFYPKHQIIPNLISYELFRDINDAMDFDISEGESKNMIEIFLTTNCSNNFFLKNIGLLSTRII